MGAFLASTFAVAIGEIGDKTQLLAVLLAARFRRPVPIIAGIFVATIANHALAAWLGQWVAANTAPEVLRWLLGGAFLAVAVWVLKPDRMDDQALEYAGYGVFALACVTFFLAEMGDKTQVATVMLAARYQELVPVIVGTTVGMMAANVPIVLLGKALSPAFPFRLVRWIAAGVFALLGLTVLIGPRLL